VKKLFALIALFFAFSGVVMADGPWHGPDRDDRPYWHPVPGWSPGLPPPPGCFPPGYPVPPPGYVFTCFSQNNCGQWFYATHFDPNVAQAAAMNFCFQTGCGCVPTGCR
jgi:hypothetical protein